MGSVRTPIRVAIVGVGNCSASLVQGVEYYRDADPAARVPGLMHVELGGYHVRDVEFVAAFDVDAKKVGRDLSEAIFASENNTIKIADVPPMDVTVQRGTTLDGLGKYYRETIEESDENPVDVVQALRDARVDVLVCYLPVGSEQAAKFYAQCAIDARVAFVNALPVFIAGTPEWAEKFRAAGVPIVGDDIKSQVGATITHRVMAKLFEDRGVILDRTYQLNVGGNMDFKNMLERNRLESKKISKTQSVTSQLERDAAVLEQLRQHPVGDGRAHLALDVVADDRDARGAELLGPLRRAGDEHRQSVDESDARVDGTLRVEAGGVLRPDRQVADEDVDAGLAQGGDDVDRGVGRLLNHLAVVPAKAVVGVAPLDRDAGGRHVADADGVVLAGSDGLGEVTPDLLAVDVEGGDELDVGDVVVAELNVHQPGDALRRVGVAVVLDSLNQ